MGKYKKGELRLLSYYLQKFGNHIATQAISKLECIPTDMYCVRNSDDARAVNGKQGDYVTLHE